MKYPKNLEYVKASQDASDNLDMPTEATNAELNEAITDEWGVKYRLRCGSPWIAHQTC